METPVELTRSYFLTAGETDAEGRMPVSLFIERAIEIATEHANMLGIGYAALIEHGIGWVLTRISLDIREYPAINDTYSFTTWIESYNRLFSDRCYVVCDAQGREIAHIRSMWMAIDMAKRTAADLTAVEGAALPISGRKCPVPMQRKMPALAPDAPATDYVFKYSDIDFNRHVNTVQYVRHILNLWSLDYFDKRQIRLFEIAFHQECYYGDAVRLRLEAVGQDSYRCEIERGGQRAIACQLRFEPRTN